MSEFDGGLKVGDLITAYRAGWHRVTRIERRFVTQDDVRYQMFTNRKVGDEYCALVYYVTIVTGKFKKSKSKKEHCCDVTYCSQLLPADVEAMRHREIRHTNDGCDLLLEVLEGK